MRFPKFIVKDSDEVFGFNVKIISGSYIDKIAVFDWIWQYRAELKKSVFRHLEIIIVTDSFENMQLIKHIFSITLEGKLLSDVLVTIGYIDETIGSHFVVSGPLIIS